jgi:hypothetical protein
LEEPIIWASTANANISTVSANRYQSSPKSVKAIILDEFCRVCEYDRKYALRLLHSKAYLVEADTVAHCGTSTEGMFVFTVNCIDLATSWREQRAVWGKGERGVLLALQDIERSLPFPLLGFDCDNGSEFLNWSVLKYFINRRRPVQYTRSRPYHKNDNAHVSRRDARGE